MDTIEFFAAATMMDMTLNQLRIFTAVAEAGSLRAASRHLGVAQSGVTQQLRKLEAAVGGALFERGHHGTRLTAVGERLRLRAEAILGECARTEDEMRQLRGELTGRIALGAAPEAMMRLFPALLKDFRLRYPRIDVHMTSATSRMLTAWVRDGSIDFAFALVFDQSEVNDLDVAPVMASQAAVLARRGHPLAAAKRLRTLSEGEWVSTRRPLLSGGRENRLTEMFKQAKLAGPRIALTTEAVFDTLHCVAGSDYLALEPALLAQHPFFAPHLVVVPIAEQPPAAQICLLRRAGIALTPAAQALAGMASSYARMTA